MPLFAYRCEACEGEFDVLSSSPDPVACGCGGLARRVFTPFAVKCMNFDLVPAAERELVMKNKRILETREAAKIRSGEVTIKEAGPLETRPKLDRRIY